MAPSEESIVLRTTHLKKSFGEHEVLKDVNLYLLKGETLVVLGRSGTGKSVLIKSIVRLIEPDSGTIEMLGKDVDSLETDELNEIRKKTGFLFQGAALYDSMSVRENLEFPLRKQPRISRSERNQRVEEALENVGLSDAIGKMPAELSGGMKKRVGLARSLMMKPDIMFYDEPTTGLDTITAKEISRLILDVQKTHSTSSIVITHDIECARMTSNRMVILHDGVCAAEGTFSELESSETEWIRAFFR